MCTEPRLRCVQVTQENSLEIDEAWRGGGDPRAGQVSGVWGAGHTGDREAGMLLGALPALGPETRAPRPDPDLSGGPRGCCPGGRARGTERREERLAVRSGRVMQMCSWSSSE